MVFKPTTWLALGLLSFHGAEAADGTIKLPVEVDQSGKSIYFVVNDHSDVVAEAERFCAAHLSASPRDDCVSKLAKEVDNIREMREDAANSLPGITFTVNDPQGVSRRFVHEEGANPATEAATFCAEYFPQADESKCVEAILQNAAKALDEVKDRYAKTEL